MLTGAYNKNKPNERKVTSMSKMVKEIPLSDIVEIQSKSEIIAGLSSIFVEFLDYTDEDSRFKGAFACLADEAYSLKKICNSLCGSIFDCQRSD